MEKKKLTIRDIATIAGVSHMTVSRVLNGGSGVRTETREHVLSVIRSHNFIPNPKARAFSSNKSRLIGLLVSDISNPFYAELARGMEEKAHEYDYNIMFCSEVSVGKKKEALDFLLKAGVDGLVFASAKLNDSHISRFIKEGFPTVLVNRKLKGEDANHVVCDNRKGAGLLMSHLFLLGYQKIAIITGSSDLSTGVERLDGYYRSHHERGLVVNEDYIVQGPFDKDTGYNGTHRLIGLSVRPQAIFAGNDYIAMGVLDALDEVGLRVPEDVAVVGFDNTHFAAHSRIKLTTVSQRKYEMGSIGVTILIDSIEKQKTDYRHHVVLEPKLIIRESCGHKLKTRD
jgi:LacI family transcriptional regulator